VRGQRESMSGVSLDEEAAELMKFQRAYQASARVISIIDSMLDTVVNGMGRS
jgi:flagellar hook-associated protein 1 FlgK